MLCIAPLASAQAPAAKGGALDLSHWDFSRDGIVNLAGEWRFAWDRFDDPAAPTAEGAITVPAAWNDAAGKPPGAFGHATYRLNIDCRPGERLALVLPLQHSAARYYVNGRLAAEQGKPDASAAFARPAFLQQIAPIEAPCPLQIVAHVSNHDMRQGGLLRSVELGGEREIQARRERGLARDLFALGGILVLSLLPILFWLGRREDRAPLWMGIYGLSSSVFLALGGERVAQPWVAPLGWEAGWKIVLLSSMLGLAAFPSFLRELYPRHFPRLAHRAILLATGAIALLVALTPARIYTQVVPAVFALCVLIAGGVVLVLLRAALASRRDAWLLLAGAGVLIATVTHDMVQISTLLAVKLTPWGLLAFSIAPAILIAQRFARALRAERLADRAKFTSDLVDSVPVALAMRDLKGNFVQVNRKWEEYFGARREDVVGRHVSERVRGGMLDALLALDRTVLERGPGAVLQQDDFDYRGRKFTQTRTVMADAQGSVLGVLIASIDTSERAAIDARMREQVALTEGIVAQTPNAIFVKDRDGRFTLVNRGWTENFGFTAEQTLGRTVHDLFPADIAARYDEEDKRLMAQGPSAAPMETLNEGPTPGQYRIVRKAVLSRGDEVIGLVCSSIDITELKKMEQALESEQRRLDLVVRAQQVGIVDWDGRTHATFYSPRFRQILGHAPDADTSNWPDYFKVLIHPDDRTGVTARWRAFVLGKSSEGHGNYYAPEEYRLLRADGSYVWVEVAGVAVRDERGYVTRWIAAVTDVTGPREQREHLRELNLALEESVRLREEVDRIGRHDLKTPLSSIIGFSRLLRDSGRASAEDERLLGFIEQSGYRLLNMVNLSLDMLQMERGSYRFTPAAVDLRDVLEKVARDLGTHARAKQLELRIEGPRLYARAEDLLCYSLFANLARNAIEASPDNGVVTLTVAQAGEQVEVRLHNRGAVPEAVRARFFDKYSTAGKASGSGLGTYSAQLMARTQQGEIAMQSSETEGTTLTVRLKRAEPPDPSARPDETTGRSPAAAGDGEAALSVLVVDDDEYTRIFVQQFLGAALTATAANGLEALEAVRADPPDAIVMDLDMPVMGGLEAAAKIRKWENDSEHPRCAMIAMSSHDDPAIAERCLEAGFDRFLAKPVSPEALRRALAELTRGTDRTGTVSPQNEAAAAIDDPVQLRAKLKDALPGFLASRRALIGELERALAAGDAAQARALAHKLAGSFALYGFRWAAGQGKMIEKRAGEGSLAGLAGAASELRRHLDNVRVEIAE